MSGLHRAGYLDVLPLGLLTRAWLRSLLHAGPDSAQADLDEAWDAAAADLAAAERLIRECGYHRRDGELADVKRAILGEP